MRVQPTQNGQTDSQSKTELCTQSAWRAGSGSTGRAKRGKRPAGWEQSRGKEQARKFPSRHERQMKRSLRGKKPNRKRRKIREKCAHKTHGRQTGTGHKSHTNGGRPRKNGHPRQTARRAGRRTPLRTGKIRIRSFACPERPCEPKPPKNRFTVFGRHGLFCCALLLKRAFCCALRAAHRTKGGAAPLNPAAF